MTNLKRWAVQALLEWRERASDRHDLARMSARGLWRHGDPACIDCVRNAALAMAKMEPCMEQDPHLAAGGKQ